MHDWHVNVWYQVQMDHVVVLLGGSCTSTTTDTDTSAVTTAAIVVNAGTAKPAAVVWPSG